MKSSNDSLPQTNLAGITEDDSEPRVEDPKTRSGAVNLARENLPRQQSAESQTRSVERNEVTSADITLNRSNSVKTQRSPNRARTTSSVDKALPPTPADIERQKSQKIARKPNLNHSERDATPSVEGRKSSQSTRPSPGDMYDANGYKQKVKFGPRPSMESVGNSEYTDRSNAFRPVSTLPAGLRMPPRKSVQPPRSEPGQVRPQSQQSQRPYPGSISSQETLRAAPVTAVQISDRNSSATSNGRLTPAKTPIEAKSLNMTPEKKRLMKALELRQKQLAAQRPNQDSKVDGALAGQLKESEPDGAALNATNDAHKSRVDSDLAHVAGRDLSREESCNIEASPISLPETSEGLSTQASSVSDGDDSAERKEQQRNLSWSPPNSDSTPSYQFEDRFDGELIEAQESSAALESNEISTVPNASSINEAAKIHETIEPPSVKREASTCNGKPPEVNENASLDAPQSAVISSIDFTDGNAKSQPADTMRIVSSPSSSAEEHCVSAQPAVAECQTRQAKLFETDATQVFVTTTENPDPSEEASPPDTQSKPTALSSDTPATNHERTNRAEAGDGGSFVPSQLLGSPTDHVAPQDVPLPPIDPDEENTLLGSLIEVPPTVQVHAEAERQPTDSQSQESPLMATQQLTSGNTNGQPANPRTREPNIIIPPEMISNPEHSDEHFLSDDSFMEELKSATVQEAKPISVSRSPMKPPIIRSESEQKLIDMKSSSRSVSSPIHHPNDEEEIFSSTRLPTSSSRSFSASQSTRDTQQVPQMPKKIGVSSGISQRIKALEQLSIRPTSPQSGPPSSNPQFITLRKISVRTPSTLSPSPPPESVRPISFTSLNKTSSPRPESVSVTATIIRDTRIKSPEGSVKPFEPCTMELQQSPLVVEHQTMAPPSFSPLKSSRPRYSRYSSARSGSASSTEHKLDALTTRRRESFASMTSRSSRSDVELPPRSLSDSSLISGLSSLDGTKEEKREGKRSRLMKRMSNLSTMSKRSIAHALNTTPREAPIVESHEPNVETTSKAVDVGDVNIQFPDTLVSLILT